MAEEEKEKDEKFDFDSSGEALAYISLEQARIVAARHTRENRDFYGRRYSRRELIWEVLDSEEGDDYYYIRLSYKPAGRFHGEPGIEQFTIDKTGTIELREILSHPVDRGLWWVILGGGVLAAVVAVVIGFLFAFGVLPPGGASSIEPFVDVPLSPEKPARLVSPRTDVTVEVPAGAVTGPAQLTYQRVPLTKDLELPAGYIATEKVFELSVASSGRAKGASFLFNRPVLLTVSLSAEDAALAGGVASNVVIQHFGEKGRQWWVQLPTTVDFSSSTARAQMDSLSVFALTIRSPSTPSPTTLTEAAATAISPVTPPAPQPATKASRTPTPVPSFELTTTTIPDNGGAVTGAGVYPAGSSVPVEARPMQGWAFAGWSGDCTGVGSCVLTMDSEKTVTASFTQSLHNLSAVKVGQGRVSMNPAGGTYLEGTLVRVSAVASTGWTFEGWSGSCVGSETCVITMTADKQITATFSRVMHNLSVVRVGMGEVVLVPSGGTHVKGTVVTAKASAATGWKFEGWTGPCSGAGACTVTMTSDQTITAKFAKVLITLKVTNVGKGAVRLNPPGGAYDKVVVVTPTPVPSPGWKFDSWSETCTGAGPCVITLDSDKRLTATFTEVLHVLTVNIVGGGMVSLNPAGGAYRAGTVVTAEAVPSAGWKLDGWTGPCLGTGACTIGMDSNQLLTATFSLSVPVPQLAFAGTESYEAGGKEWVRYKLPVSNWANFGAVLFESAPDLPPCGLNTSASRTWVTVLDAVTDNELNVFCAFSSPEALESVWFAVQRGVTPPDAVYLRLLDRRTGTVYSSNTVDLSGRAQPDTFSVLNVTASVTPRSFSGECPARFSFFGTITSNGVAGTASYRWVRSDGAASKVQEISLTAGEVSKTVSISWSLGGPGFAYAGWLQLEVLSPNALTSGRAEFSLECDKRTAEDRILFASDRDGNWEIYVMEADGANQINLTNDPFSDLEPAWSPDRGRIAYNHAGDIYVMDSDGGNKTRLTFDGSDDLMPAWSPDGSKIAFTSKRDGNHEIYAMNADGSQKVRLTNSPGRDEVPAWSPDGKKIAFASDREENFEIYVMDADGFNVINLTLNSAFDYQPDWSPDGSKIAFMTTGRGAYGGNNSEIYVMNADGSKPVNLTNHGHFDADPTWSPDGKKIAFESHRITNIQEVWVMNADGSNPANLTNGPTGDLQPDW